uniref:(California timema) hypothetical protein n=1 Tax=Timema californicum TaxID=61474 RepID=A0A7R9JA06_TIMCA|nr:unnamed protein product [Timema californicum]
MHRNVMRRGGVGWYGSELYGGRALEESVLANALVGLSSTAEDEEIEVRISVGCMEWARRISPTLSNKTPTQLNELRICADHFAPDQFMNILKKRLVWNAVPSLFLPKKEGIFAPSESPQPCPSSPDLVFDDAERSSLVSSTAVFPHHTVKLESADLDTRPYSETTTTLVPEQLYKQRLVQSFREIGITARFRKRSVNYTEDITTSTQKFRNCQQQKFEVLEGDWLHSLQEPFSEESVPFESLQPKEPMNPPLCQSLGENVEPTSESWSSLSINTLPRLRIDEARALRLCLYLKDILLETPAGRTYYEGCAILEALSNWFSLPIVTRERLLHRANTLYVALVYGWNTAIHVAGDSTFGVAVLPE